MTYYFIGVALILLSVAGMAFGLGYAVAPEHITTERVICPRFADGRAILEIKSSALVDLDSDTQTWFRECGKVK